MYYREDKGTTNIKYTLIVVQRKHTGLNIVYFSESIDTRVLEYWIGNCMGTGGELGPY